VSAICAIERGHTCAQCRAADWLCGLSNRSGPSHDWIVNCSALQAAGSTHTLRSSLYRAHQATRSRLCLVRVRLALPLDAAHSLPPTCTSNSPRSHYVSRTIFRCHSVHLAPALARAPLHTLLVLLHNVSEIHSSLSCQTIAHAQSPCVYAQQSFRAFIIRWFLILCEWQIRSARHRLSPSTIPWSLVTISASVRCSE